MRAILIILLISITSIGCSHKNVKPLETAVPYTGNMVVSFTSIGTGINRAAYSKLQTWIDEYNAKNKPAITYTFTARGREGEKELCFSPAGNPSFLSITAQIKNLLKDEKQVFITEHQDCPK